MPPRRSPRLLKNTKTTREMRRIVTTYNPTMMNAVFEHMEEQIQLALLLIYSPLYLNDTDFTKCSENSGQSGYNWRRKGMKGASNCSQLCLYAISGMYERSSQPSLTNLILTTSATAQQALQNLQNVLKTVVRLGTIGGGKGWRDPQIALTCCCMPYLGHMKGFHNLP